MPARKHEPSEEELGYYPEHYRFLQPVFALDKETRALQRGYSKDAEHAFFGYPRAIRRILAQEYIHPRELKAVFEHNAGQPIPSLVQAYTDALERGEVKRQRGRKPPAAMDERWLELAYYEFRRAQHVINRRKTMVAERRRWATAAPRRRERLKAGWWNEGSTYEAAIRFVWYRFYPDLTEKSVQNMLSRYLNPQD